VLSPEIQKLLLNGIKAKCPKCGQGPVLSGYLTKNDQCPQCAESFDDLNADDGPAWFAMFFVGLLLIPIITLLGIYEWFPMWGNILIITLFTVILSLLALPRLKGLFIAILWYLRENK